MKRPYGFLFFLGYQRDISHLILNKKLPYNVIQHSYKSVYGIAAVKSGIILIIIHNGVTLKAHVNAQRGLGLGKCQILCLKDAVSSDLIRSYALSIISLIGKENL